MLYSKEKKKMTDVSMPDIVWVPTYLGMILMFIWKFESGETLIMIPILMFCSFIFELIYRAVFGEKRHSFSCLVMVFVSQCIIWGLIFYFGVFGIWKK